jgi:hypothetical protein
VDLLIYIIVVIVLAALAVYAVRTFLPAILPQPFLNLVLFLIIVIAIVLVANRAGVF